MKNITDLSVVISAPSGAGKTSIIKRLLSCEYGFEFSVSTTTRSVRNGETEGKSYYYVSKDIFRQKINSDSFVEWAEVHGSYYGTEKKEIDRIRTQGNIPLLDIDVQGGKLLKNSLERAVFIFIVPPSMSELEKRLRSRNTDTEKQITIRMNNALLEMKEHEFYDYIVINENLKSAVEQVKSIVVAEMCKKERMSQYIKKRFGGLFNDNTIG